MDSTLQVATEETVRLVSQDSSNPEGTELPQAAATTTSEVENVTSDAQNVDDGLLIDVDNDVDAPVTNDNNDNNNNNSTNDTVFDHNLTNAVNQNPLTRNEQTIITHPSSSSNLPLNTTNQSSESETAYSYDGLEIIKIHDNKAAIESEEIDYYIDKAFERSFHKSLFFQNATRTDAIKYLTDVDNGGYCIRRKTDKSRKPYVISVKIDDTSINHLWIRVCLHEVKKQEAPSENPKPKPKIETEIPQKPNEQTEQQDQNPAAQSSPVLEDYDLVHDGGDFQPNSPTPEDPSPLYEETTNISDPPPENQPPKSTDTEIRFGYHIDSGAKMFKSVLDLLKFYEGADLGTMFHKCGVTMKCVVDLEQFVYVEVSGTYLEPLEGANQSSAVREVSSANQDKKTRRSNDRDGSVNEEGNGDILESQPSVVDDVLHFNSKRYKILHKDQEVAYDFSRGDYENLKSDANVFEKLVKGSKVQVLQDYDGEAVENNWLKCCYSGSVLYAPKNFVIG